MAKLAAVALAGAVCAVTLRQQRGEIALVLALVAGCVLLSGAMDGLRAVTEFVEELAQLAGLSAELLQPLLKTVGIALVTHLAAALCKDAGEGGIASSLEFSGGVAALCAALPLLRQVVEGLETLM
jgi:stage III sporulation protein AD